jgi:DNA-binding NarL/FixJ family response regulator
VLTTFGDDDHLYPALTAGACGFLLKDAPPGDLLDGVRRAAAGDSPFSQEVLRRLVQRAVHARTAPPPALAGLTARERDVLDLVADGLSNAEIAERLIVSAETIKTHISRVLNKLGVRDRVQAVITAYESGLVQPGSKS